MKLRELFGMMDDHGDVVSVYDTTPGNPYHTLYEGIVDKCPSKLLDRDALSFYPSFVNEEPGVCIYLDGYDGLEEHGMKKHEVMRVVEVNYKDMSDEELRKVPYLRDLRCEWSCTSFDDGEDYVCLRDLDEGPDGRDYAVYLRSGKLLCLLCDSGNALEGYEDRDFGYERNKLYMQIALLAGWPENMHDFHIGMTWRQLIDEMKKMPKEFLDTQAFVWRPEGGGTLAAVRGVKPWLVGYDGRVPGPGDEDDNCYYIDNGFPYEE